jgi:hypothetical protein
MKHLTTRYFAITLSVLVGSSSFALAQTGAGAPGGSPGTSAGQDGASNGTTATNSGEGSTTGMQGTTGTNVSGSINSKQGTGSTPGTSPGGPNNSTSRPAK